MGDKLLTAFAGRCLALLGPLPPEKIAFSSQLLTLESQQSLDNSHRIGIAADSIAVLKQVLQQLAVHVIDNDCTTVAAAQSTLRQVRSRALSNRS